MNTRLLLLCLAALLAGGAGAYSAQPISAPGRPHFADYDAELRGADRRVDAETMAARLKELHVTTYYWLVWHTPNDWDDLKRFLPKAAQAGIEVWVYLVPPTEMPPQDGTLYSEPFRLDYRRWAEEIARLSLQHTNLTGWVIDDFYANHEFFTPDCLRDLQRRAKSINPRLVFLPLMYFGEIRRPFVEAYREVIDGVVVAYPQGREEIDQAWTILNDATTAFPGELAFPPSTPSRPGDYVQASQSAQVRPAGRYTLRFREKDDFTGPTSGYHFKQLLVDGQVVWEEDVAGGSSARGEVTVDLGPTVSGKKEVTVAFRIQDKKGVSNFGVRWQVKDLEAKGLKLAAPLTAPRQWTVATQGAFEAGFGESLQGARRQFHVPFIVMTAADGGQFRKRHGEPASPERMAQWLETCLQAWQAGKCDGVVTYALGKEPGNRTFDLTRDLFGKYRAVRPKRAK